MNKLLSISLIIVVVFSLFLFFSKKQSSSNPSSQNQEENIVIKGSDTEVQVVSSLAEAFSEKYEEIPISVTGGGSSIGIAALINQEVSIANSSRRLTEQEQQQADQKGLKLHEFIVARDGLSVIVHPENKLASITMDELGRVYRGEITNWQDLGGQDLPITLYGRQSTSGTYGFFRETVVHDDYSETMRNMEGNQAILDAVKNDISGIGYVGIGYVKDENNQPKEEISIIPVAMDEEAEPISPLDSEAVLAGEYPIFRPIYQFLSTVPVSDSALHKFLLFENSDEGQDIVIQSGFYPITEADKTINANLIE